MKRSEEKSWPFYSLFVLAGLEIVQVIILIYVLLSYGAVM